MYFSRRRLYGVAPALVFFLCVLYYFQRGFVPPGVSSPVQHTAPQTPAINDSEYDATLIWRTLRVRYPVESLRPLPTGPPLRLPPVQTFFQSEKPHARDMRLRRRAAVKAAFSRCWDAYKSRAWGHDEVTPLSGNARDTFGGWGATLIDSLDTLWIMDMKHEFADAVTAVANISFVPDSTGAGEINVFETNIRYLGGLLSAYDLSTDHRLLRKAREVGDMLLVAFDTPNRMPITRWDLHAAARGDAQKAHGDVLVAEIGSLCMEFTRLSLLTGDARYYDAVQRVMELFRDQQDSGHLPGMWPLIVDASKAEFNQYTAFTLGAMADSMYEYLPKMHALVGGLLPMYRDMYEKAMTTAMKYNFFRPMLPDESDILVSSLVDIPSEGPSGAKLQPEGQHLVCFAGGMLALGGRLVESAEHLDKAHKLVDGCVWTYRALPLGIMPETFNMIPCANVANCPWDEAAWKRAVQEKAGDSRSADAIIAEHRIPQGFVSIPDTRYILRPEAIESVFVLYRITGRSDLLESAWDMWQAIDRATRTELANSALSDITVPKGAPAPMSDSMESFWMGETLKYFYLIFSEPDLISLDDWVFNTEAHPFRRLSPDQASWYKIWR